MQTPNLYQQRLDSLYTDLARLEATPHKNVKAFQNELKLLHERLQELEQHVAKTQAEAPPAKNGNGHNSNLQYEREKFGFVYAGDAVKPYEEGSINSTLERTLNAPLAAGGEVIGQIRLGTSQQRDWTPDEVSMANTVAQQASLQIQNLRLLAATEKARAEAESATRQFIHQGWETYMDAIHEKEHIGYSYDQQAVTPVTDHTRKDTNHEELVTVMGAEVGKLQLKTERLLTESEKDMIASVARQIGQQVENLRLLADASRARAEAEDASRRLAHDNWQTYVAKTGETSRNFLYDTVEVKSVEDADIPYDLNFTEPLSIQGEMIGQLAVSGMKNVSPEAANLAKAIAAQASIHLETLRLNEELRKRAAELQELDRLKSAFLANMSHELRTPLNSILGFSDVILEGLNGPLTHNMDNDVRLIQKNGQHLLHLINDVLDMAKIESGKMNLNPEKFKVHKIFEEVVSITSTLASEKNLALFIDSDSDAKLELFADNTRMRQVLINLVNNSIKFTETGKITLHVAPMDKTRLLITVRDTGIGIPPESLEAIFQEFTQVDTSTTRKVGGTGLGLPISRRLVEMHGGRLWAESTGVAGEGSSFFVELPLEARLVEVVEKREK